MAINVDTALMVGVKDLRDLAGEIELWQPVDGYDELVLKLNGVCETAMQIADRVRAALPTAPAEPDPDSRYGDSSWTAGFNASRR